MYLCHWDNKPPLFHFLNVSFAATDSYLLMFFLTMGIANGIAAILIWRLCRRWDYDRVGLVSAFLFIALMAEMTWRVNPRNYAVVFLLLAVLASGPIRAGIYAATAGLFSQFAVFSIPAIIWFRIDFSRSRYRWLVKFATAGLGTVLMSFGLVAILWGPDAALTGFQYSFLSSGDYVGRYADRGLSLYGDPIAWVYKLYRLLYDYLWLVFGGVVGAFAVRFQGRKMSKFESMVLLVTLLTALPLTIRTAAVYLVLLAPFLSILSILGLDYIFRSGDFQTVD